MTMRELRRPRTRGELRPMLVELADACEDHGIARGERWIFATPDELRQIAGQDAVGPFVRGSDTSRQAAWGNRPRSGTQRERIICAVLRAEDGLTRDELARDLGLPDSTVDPRVLEACHGGWIEQTARTRPTRTGNEAHILMATDKAIAVYARETPATQPGR